MLESQARIVQAVYPMVIYSNKEVVPGSWGEAGVMKLHFRALPMGFRAHFGGKSGNDLAH
jgi:hypothetical protein